MLLAFVMTFGSPVTAFSYYYYYEEYEEDTKQEETYYNEDDTYTNEEEYYYYDEDCTYLDEEEYDDEEEYYEDQYDDDEYYNDEYYDDDYYEEEYEEEYYDEYEEDKYPKYPKPEPILIKPLVAPTWQEAMQSSLDWLVANAVGTGFHSLDWTAVALGRAGNLSAEAQSWLNTYRTGITAPTLITDAARVSLAVNALGYNARSFNGQNLTAPFATFNSTIGNADMFALIALNSMAENTAAQPLYANAILRAQRANGSWAWPPTPPFDYFECVDMTSMAIQALAPYYNSNNPAVVNAVTRARSWISTQWIDSVESHAQIIIALTSIGVNPSNHVATLMTFYDPILGGFTAPDWDSVDFSDPYWFLNPPPYVVNQISTENAALALVAYQRFNSGQPSLFNISNTSRANITLPPFTPPPTPPPDVDVIVPPQFVPDGMVLIYVRDNQRIFAREYFVPAAHETVYTLLRRTGLTVRQAGGYVYYIAGLGEFDDGLLSGWMYRVNGQFPLVPAVGFGVSEGDLVEWVFTRDLGADVGDNFGVTGVPPLLPPPLIPEIELELPEEAETVEVEMEAEVADGTATLNIAPDVVQTLIEVALAAEIDNITINIANTDDVHRVEINLTSRSIGDLVDNNISLTIRSDVAALAFDIQSLAGLISDMGEDLEDLMIHIGIEVLDADSEEGLSDYQRYVLGDRVAISLMIMVNDETVSNFDGLITITIPYTLPQNFPVQDQELLTIYHLSYYGNLREMLSARYEGGQMAFATNHFSLFFVSEWLNPFEDVSRDDWFFRYVRFVYSHGLMDELSPGKFLPHELVPHEFDFLEAYDITRAELAATLYYLATEDEDDCEYEGKEEEEPCYDGESYQQEL